MACMVRLSFNRQKIRLLYLSRADIDEVTALGHKFSVILSRQITDEESVILQDAGRSGATFGIDSLPADADVSVTKIDFDDVVSPSLGEAIQAALEAVNTLPNLSVPLMSVPVQTAEDQLA
jgi:hypothetical protein